MSLRFDVAIKLTKTKLLLVKISSFNLLLLFLLLWFFFWRLVSHTAQQSFICKWWPIIFSYIHMSFMACKDCWFYCGGQFWMSFFFFVPKLTLIVRTSKLLVLTRIVNTVSSFPAKDLKEKQREQIFLKLSDRTLTLESGETLNCNFCITASGLAIWYSLYLRKSIT